MAKELDGLDAHQLLQVFMAGKGARQIGSKRGDRKEWLKAEEEILTDLRVLATSERRPKATLTPTELPDRQPADVLETFLDALEERVTSMSPEDAAALAKRTRCMPLDAAGLPDWTAVRELVDAWATSMTYQDAEGDETHVPSEAEQLLELWEAHRGSRKRVPKAKDFASLVEERGDKSAEPFSIQKTFKTGDWISHKKFGEGLVLEAGEKIKVRFADQERVLVHQPPRADRIGEKKR